MLEGRDLLIKVYYVRGEALGCPYLQYALTRTCSRPQRGPSISTKFSFSNNVIKEMKDRPKMSVHAVNS